MENGLKFEHVQHNNPQPLLLTLNMPFLAGKELTLCSIYVQTSSLTEVHLNTIVSTKNVDFITETARVDDVSAE